MPPSSLPISKLRFNGIRRVVSLKPKDKGNAVPGVRGPQPAQAQAGDKTNASETQSQMESRELEKLQGQAQDAEDQLKRVSVELEAARRDLEGEERRKVEALRMKDEELQAVRDEKAGMEDRLKNLGGELDAAKEVHQELQDHERQVVEALRVRGEELQAVRGDMANMENRLNALHEELEAARQLIRDLQNEEQPKLGGRERDPDAAGVGEMEALKARIWVLEADKGHTERQLEEAQRQVRELREQSMGVFSYIPAVRPIRTWLGW